MKGDGSILTDFCCWVTRIWWMSNSPGNSYDPVVKIFNLPLSWRKYYELKFLKQLKEKIYEFAFSSAEFPKNARLSMSVRPSFISGVYLLLLFLLIQVKIPVIPGNGLEALEITNMTGNGDVLL